MRIGYACLTVGVPDTQLKSCIMKNATPQRLMELISHNLEALENMLLYNAYNNIKLFRISSDLIPFGSSPVNKLEWWHIFKDKFSKLSHLISEKDIRVSMHPGQYTVLNSPNTDVVLRAVDDLIYHNRLLDALGAGQSSKIILHLGGVYGDKKSALSRLITTYSGLDSRLKKRIVFENDDKAYTICDVLDISDKLSAPAVYDNLHCDVNPCEKHSHSYWVKKAAQTWEAADGIPKIHYSQQASERSKGAHSQTIAAREFSDYINHIGTQSDIMLEVKDKNISALKCINLISGDKDALYRDWQTYKYKMLELSPSDYIAAGDIMASPNPDALAFYYHAEKALGQSPTSDHILFAAKTIWQECFLMAEKQEHNKFKSLCTSFSGKKREITQLKGYIGSIAAKYGNYELMNSFYLNLNT